VFDTRGGLLDARFLFAVRAVLLGAKAAVLDARQLLFVAGDAVFDAREGLLDARWGCSFGRSGGCFACLASLIHRWGCCFRCSRRFIGRSRCFICIFVLGLGLTDSKVHPIPSLFNAMDSNSQRRTVSRL